MTPNQTKLLSLKSKHTRKNRHASGLNENGSIALLINSIPADQFLVIALIKHFREEGGGIIHREYRQ